MQDTEVARVLVAEALLGEDREDLLRGKAAGALDERVGTLGRPSGKRSNGFWAVSSIIWSFETVKIWAWAAAGVITAAAKRERRRTVEGFMGELPFLMADGVG
jgi:hypothetical protein